MQIQRWTVCRDMLDGNKVELGTVVTTAGAGKETAMAKADHKFNNGNGFSIGWKFAVKREAGKMKKLVQRGYGYEPAEIVKRGHSVEFNTEIVFAKFDDGAEMWTYEKPNPETCKIKGK